MPVSLASVRYVASQPWPFPRSLMIGFYCRLESSRIPGAAQMIPGAAQMRTVGGEGGASGYELLGSEGRRAAISVGLKPNEVELVRRSACVGCAGV